MKKNVLSISISCCVLVLIIGCNKISNDENSEIESSGFDLGSVENIIREKTDKFTEAHITRDTAFLNNSFAKDARIFPPNSNVVSGKTDIAQLNFDWVSYGIHEFKEVSTRFYGNEDYVVDEGEYNLKYGQDSTVDSGKYINIWKSEDGEWKIFSNIWNNNLPIE